MAKLKKRPDGRYQGKLRIATVDGAPKYKFVFGKSPAEVNEKLAALRVELGAGVDLMADRKFSFWADRWIRKQEQIQTPEWHSQCRFRAEVWKAALGDRELARINTADLEQVLYTIAEKNPHTGRKSSKKTIVEYKDVIQRIFTYALQNRVITFDPSAYLTCPAGTPKKTRRALTPEEIAAVAGTEDEARLPAMIMIYAGLRLGEVAALTWSDVDLAKKTITINKSLNFRSKAIKDPKTDAGVRTVPIPQPLAAALASAPRSSIFVCPHNGAAYTIGSWNKTWQRFKRRIGLDVSAHYLRHTYCTLLYEAGVDVLTAMYFMGHADAATTMQIYAHLRAQKKLQSVTKLDAYLQNEKTDEITKKQTVL